MDRIFEAIEEWMRNLLTGMVSSNLTTMYTDVNEKTGQIAAQVGQTPQGWNGSIYSMIQNLSESVIVPIAGMIITFVLCYELISMLTEKNNMHDIDISIRLVEQSRSQPCPTGNGDRSGTTIFVDCLHWHSRDFL